ncbi:MAG: amino acid permease [Rothia dentocariosa]|uniref:amino acid permease n=1 Tax=Rothia aeria TaxID=172042 RepID=UPI001CB4992D|nr:amino acid permease [Rothia sp. RSM482]MBF1652887.1 amino acid permease [Rothia dentocariosa]
MKNTDSTDRNPTSVDTAKVQPGTPHLQRVLTLRHIMFIALGSAIGTGLFYGSASAIQLAGPSVLVAYMVGGAAVFMVMRAMGELALANPVSGAFSEYATRYLGRWAGFVTGWSYALEMALVAIADVTAFAVYMQFWFPNSPAWVWIVSVLLILLAINLTKVKAFGEAEFWFTLVKVSAIIAMIIGGVILLFVGVQAHDSVASSVTNLWSLDGGFMPNQFTGFLACFTVVMFSFGGIETIGIAAGETKNPRVSIPKAIRTVPARIMIFYVLTLGVIMSLYPWYSVSKENSPFVQIFSSLGIPAAAGILNIVVITAAVSAMNADVYGAGRMLYGLAQRGLAPASFRRVSRTGAPWMTTLLMIVVMAVGVIVNVLFKDAFEVVASLATFATVLVWVMILLAHIAYKRGGYDTEKQPVRLPLWVSYLTLAFMAFVVVLLGLFESTRLALVVGGVWCVFLLGYYLLVLRGKQPGVTVK